MRNDSLLGDQRRVADVSWTCGKTPHPRQVATGVRHHVSLRVPGKTFTLARGFRVFSRGTESPCYGATAPRTPGAGTALLREASPSTAQRPYGARRRGHGSGVLLFLSGLRKQREARQVEKAGGRLKRMADLRRKMVSYALV